MIKIEKDIEKYIDEVEGYLVCLRKNKQKVIDEIKNSIYVYAEENGISDIAEIYDRFGTPEEIASQALSTVDPKMIKKVLSIKRAVIAALAIIVSMVAAMIIIELIDCHKDIHGTFEDTIIIYEGEVDFDRWVSYVDESMNAEIIEENAKIKEKAK